MDYYYYDDQIAENDLERNDDYEYDTEILGEETFSDLFKGCMMSSTQQIQQYILILLGCGLIHRILWKVTTLLQQTAPPKTCYHIISIFCGILALWLYVGTSTCYVFLHVLNVTSFLRIMHGMLQTRRKAGLYSCLYTIGCLLIAEILLTEDKYETIRGPQMVVSMKLISVGFDIQDGREHFQWFPTVGYLCSPSSLILGPWVPYRVYNEHNKAVTKKLKLLLKICLYLVFSVIFLNLSNCILPWTKQVWNGGLWFRTYMDALSVRCSHYFISYLSHAILLSSASSPTTVQIVKPMEIEIPRSLSVAIRNWNIPMHLWLKENIFQRVRATKSSYLLPILATYLVSCSVHGGNFKVHLVLVSLGIFSYVENKLRRTLAHIFNACIDASPCRKNNCKYQHCPRNSRIPWYYPNSGMVVRMVNIMFSFIALLQLTYLGVMLNSGNISSVLDYLSVWSNMNFFGHWLAMAMALFYVAI